MVVKKDFKIFVALIITFIIGIIESEGTVTIIPTPGPTIPTTTRLPLKVYKHCELAHELTYFLKDTGDWHYHLEEWLCIADFATGFNGAYISTSPDDPTRVYYGIFKISNQWCGDGYSGYDPRDMNCTDLLEDMEDNMRCSQYIYEETGFQEWSEYDYACFSHETDYLLDCAMEPYFDARDNPESVKVFEEYDEGEFISWSARGYPPPVLELDAATKEYVQGAGDRLHVYLSQALGADGNWTMQYTIGFYEVMASGDRIFTCNARNIAGNSSLPFTVTVISREHPNREVSNPNQESFWTQPTIIGGALGLSFLALLLPLAYYVLIRRRRKVITLQKIYQQFIYGKSSEPGDGTISDPDYLSCVSDNAVEVYQKILDLPFSRELEILPNRLTLHEVLGRGAFGVVHRGELDKKVIVAVKTLAKDAEEFKLTALLSEVKIMNYVGKHPNIVQLIGVQYSDLKKGIVYVAVEYCPRGSLEEFLHGKRRELSRPREEFGSVFNVPGYIGVTHVPNPLSTAQLLTFSHQVCTAMEFLASKWIIHGDLAARNVLLDSNYVAKISDFGLSRQIYDIDKKYVVAFKGTVLPWRSLAIETLKHGKFSTESDVWAFGVFLWEVLSLAEVPYAVMLNSSPEFAKYLEDGFRLEIPEFANEQIYQLMRKCWEAVPSNRINFQQLSSQLLCLYEAECMKKPN